MVTARLLTDCSDTPHNIHINTREYITRTRAKRKVGYFLEAHPVFLYAFCMYSSGYVSFRLCLRLHSEETGDRQLAVRSSWAVLTYCSDRYAPYLYDARCLSPTVSYPQANRAWPLLVAANERQRHSMTGGLLYNYTVCRISTNHEKQTVSLFAKFY